MQRAVTASVLRRTAIKPKVTVIQKPVTQVAANPQALQRTTKVRQQPIPQRNQVPPTPEAAPVIARRNSSVNTVRDRINNTRRELVPQVPQRKVPPKITYLSSDLTPDQVERVRKLKGSAIGRYLVILGNGPSLEQVDTGRLAQYDNIKLCTINVPDKRCWPTPYWAFYDRSQYHRHKEIYKVFGGTIFNSTGIKEGNPNSIKFKHNPGLGWSKDISRGVYVGMSSVYATLQIAMYMEFNRIYVVGCDMNESMDLGKTHFYGINPDVKPEERRKRFVKEANWYDRMTEVLTENEKQKIVFCSKGVNKWPFMSHFTTVRPDEATQFIIQDTGYAS